MSDAGADAPPTDPAGRLEELLERVSDALELEAEVHVEEDEETLHGRVEGEDVALLIGRHGATIDALEQLALRIAFRQDDERKRVSIDAAGYRARRAEALERQAERAAAEALQGGRPVPLEAMVASERRLVHEYLRDRGDLETYSEGDEPARHLVVAPVVSSS